METAKSPLLGPPPAEIPLATPPLVFVITQVRFPIIASIEKAEFIAPFQEAIQRDYPVLRLEQIERRTQTARVVRDETSSAWKFHDPTSAWYVTLASDFLALETREYTNRGDFLRRFGELLEALKSHIRPALVDRLGVRYIDRLTGRNLIDLPKLVRREVSGILAAIPSSQVRHAVAAHLLELTEEDGRALVRWGLLPAGVVHESAPLEALDEPSWILDIDAFRVYSEETCMLEVDSLVKRARAFTERIYSIFRWAVEEEFLKRHGAQT